MRIRLIVIALLLLASVGTAQTPTRSPWAEALAREAQDAVQQFFQKDQMTMPAQMIIVTARKL